MEVTLIDRTNHHLFQPLLYQVATGGLSPGKIAQPIRSIFMKAKRVAVVLDEARSVDFQARELVSARGRYPFDYLLLATGARHSYFGHPEWEEFAPGLKSIEDALEIRRRIQMAFEIAERLTDPAEKAEAMTFVIVGAGPTGVELAGAISELARFTLRRDFLHINPADARILVVDSAPRVLPTFPEELSHANRSFSLPRPGNHGHDRAQLGRGGFKICPVQWLVGMAGVALCPPDLPHRIPEQGAGVSALGLGLSHL